MQQRIFLFLTFILASCSIVKNDDTVSQQSNESIVFLVFRITKDLTPQTKKIELINKTNSDGRIKNEPESRIEWDNYLAFELYENNTIKKTLYIEHPLFKNIEYLDSNNNLTSKNIELDKEDFFIRIQVKSDNAKIRILEKLKLTGKKELTELKL